MPNAAVRGQDSSDVGGTVMHHRAPMLMSAVVLVSLLILGFAPSKTNAVVTLPTPCTPTGLVRDAHMLTAKVVNVSLVNQDVNAVDDFTGAPCDIGADYENG